MTGLSVSAAGGSLPVERRYDGAERVVVRDWHGNAIAVVMMRGPVVVCSSLGQPDFARVLADSGISACLPVLTTTILER